MAFVIMVMFFIMDGAWDDNPSWGYPMIHFLSQTVVMTICFVAASRDLKYAELYGPAIVITALLIIFICNFVR